MNLTHLNRTACTMSALVALAGTIPVAAIASPSASGNIRGAAKSFPLFFGAVPVAAMASASTSGAAPVAATASASTSGTAPVAAKVSPSNAGAAPVAVKASTSNAGAAPVVAQASPSTSGTAPVAAKVSPSNAGAAHVAVKASTSTSGATPVVAKASPSTAASGPLAAMASPSIYYVPVGESRVYRLEQPIKRVALGNPEVADYIMLNASELYVLGKKPGATNLVVWDKKGNVTTTPLQVGRNITSIKALLKVVFPKENDIQIYAWGPALVVSGSVSDTLVADSVLRIVKAYLGGTVPSANPESTLTNSASGSGSAAPVKILGLSNSSSNSGYGATGSMANSSANHGSAATAGIPGVVNLLKVRDPQQVRLEVRIAEVSRSYIESLGLGWMKDKGSTQGSLMTGFVSNATLGLILNAEYDNNLQMTVGNKLFVEAERKPSLIKILAEPTIVTMSGQEGYFLVGGKMYTPTVSSFGAVDYVERTYGVGLRFLPTVLDAGRISLKVTPEVSEPVTQPVTAGTQNNLPTFKISTVSTTVQMNEGENLVIGGLLRDNLTEMIQAVPLLGEIPLLGTLFRRTEKNSEKTELLVIVRPTLVKASAAAPELPTDRFVPPTRKELFLDGKLEGSRRVQ
jgi:pilus assembly protein CpaC